MIRIIGSEFIKSAVKPVDFPSAELAEFAFAGRSNVGKSSLLNSLTQRKLLAKVSSTPGKTRLLNFFKIRCRQEESGEDIYIQFVDLPGYGYARVSKTERESWRKMMNDFFFTRKKIQGLFLLVDIRHKADPKDIQLKEWADSTELPYCIIATKADKIAKSKLGNEVQRLRRELNTGEIPILPISSVNRYGLEKVLDWIEEKAQL